jgi:hypothetical protein
LLGLLVEFCGSGGFDSYKIDSGKKYLPASSSRSHQPFVPTCNCSIPSSPSKSPEGTVCKYALTVKNLAVLPTDGILARHNNYYSRCKPK